MNRRRDFATWLGAILGTICALFVLALGAHASEHRGALTEEFHQTYALTPDGRIELDNINGPVHISSWERNEVKVDAVKRASDRNLLTQTEIKVETTPDSVRIWTRYASEEERRKYKPEKDEVDIAEVDYTLKVPVGAQESISLIGGSLEITGVKGDLRAGAVSGRINAQGLGGGVRISTISGPVEVALTHLDESKPLSFSSVNGSVVLTIPSDFSTAGWRKRVSFCQS